MQDHIIRATQNDDFAIDQYHLVSVAPIPDPRKSNRIR